MRLIFVSIALSLVGCASHRMPGHTLLYTPDRQHNIWSYQPVEGEGFVSRPLRPDDRVVLKNGAIVSFDGEGVKVNGAHVKAQNAIVQADGKVEEGAFIRTFE